MSDAEQSGMIAFYAQRLAATLERLKQSTSALHALALTTATQGGSPSERAAQAEAWRVLREEGVVGMGEVEKESIERWLSAEGRK